MHLLPPLQEGAHGGARRRLCVGGAPGGLQWIDAQLREHFRNKTEIIGANSGFVKELNLLNRILQWGKDGVFGEPDPRHVELTLRDLYVDNGRSTSLVAPGVKQEVRRKVDGPQEGQAD